MRIRTTLEQLQDVLKDIQRRRGGLIFVASELARDFSLEDDEETPLGESRRFPSEFTEQGKSPVATEESTAQWIPPGQAVRVQGYNIADGMIYVGRTMPSVHSNEKEPALIDPGLKVSRNNVRSFSTFEMEYRPAYNRWTATQRGAYLKWLAGGRKDELPSSGFLNLFLFGLERRLLENPSLVSRAEEDALLAELQRLMQVYTMHSFASHVSRLLQFIAMRRSLAEGTWTPPDAAILETLPHEFQKVPPLVEMALAHFAQTKKPLTAEYAWAWLIHDPEYFPRTSAQRAPEQMKQLFLIRYRERYPNGHRLTLRKTPVPIAYHPISHSFGRTVYYPTQNQDKPWKCVGKSPLSHLREVASLCADELDPYSRYLSRHGEGSRYHFSAVALLPEPVLVTHPTIVRVQETLNRAMTEHRVSEEIPVAKLPVTIFRKLWETAQDWTRGDNVNLLTALERMGWIIEPDVRLGGGTLLSTLPETATIGLARWKADADPQRKTFAKSIPIIWASLTLLATIARNGDRSTLLPVVRQFLPRLPQYDPALTDRLLARWCWFLHNRDEIKSVRRDAFAELLPADRARLSALLIELAWLAYGSQGFTPERTKELTKLYKVIGADESELFVRLHAAQTGQLTTTPELVTVQTRQAAPGFALPPPQAIALHSPSELKKAGRPRKNGDVGLDMTAIQRKIEETERVTTLLTNIFEETDQRIQAIPKEYSNSGDLLRNSPNGRRRIQRNRLSCGPPEGKSHGDDRKDATEQTLGNTHQLPIDPGDCFAFAEGATEAGYESPISELPKENRARQSTSGESRPRLKATVPELVQYLGAKLSWEAAEFAAGVREMGWLPLAARDAVNDWAVEVVGETLLEGDDPVIIMPDVLQELNAESGN